MMLAILGPQGAGKTSFARAFIAARAGRPIDVPEQCEALSLLGDIAHSRVARSNIHGLLKLGAKVIVCGPPTLVPGQIAELGVEVAHDLDAVLPRCDVVNVLRIQFERQRGAFFPSIREYFHLYGMTRERLARGRKGVLILAPGPINRGVELTPEVADGPESAIIEQVTNGLAVRMAVLWLVCGPRAGDPPGEATAAEGRNH